ncbi:MAG TPA: peptide deformylase [Alphaproteobacteria bacterium]|nr:peptide deformylase [Alphaproteobacteria bacterium]
MAILKIARMGHPVLSRRAEEVADPAAPEIRALVIDMLETLADIDGAGLAAPQVHASKRVVLFRVPVERVSEHEDDRPMGLTVLVNPVIEPLGDEMERGWEGCLSVPGMMGEVPRHARIRYSGLDLEGNAVLREASGFHARVVQHECDHLDGILYPMRMDDLKRFGFEAEMRRLAQSESEASAEARERERESEPELDLQDVDETAAAQA